MPVSPSSSVVNLEEEDSQDQELPETLASPVRLSSSEPSPSASPVMKRARPSLPGRRPATLMGFFKPSQNRTKAAALVSAESADSGADPSDCQAQPASAAEEERAGIQESKGVLISQPLLEFSHLNCIRSTNQTFLFVY
jgi:hypothetical protein